MRDRPKISVPAKVPLLNAPRALSVLILDYDGCADISSSGNPLDAARKKQFLDGLHRIVRDSTEPAETLDNVAVIVTVGSARQDIVTDESAANMNGNGRCFENYQRLCDEQGWTFEPLLLADTQNNKPAGTAIKNRNLRMRSFNNNKIDILAYQLEHFKEKFPDSSIQFHFIDDDAHGHSILESNATHFKYKIPERCTLILHQYKSKYKSTGVTGYFTPMNTDMEIVERFRLAHEVSFDLCHLPTKDSIILNKLLLACVREGTEIFQLNQAYATTFVAPKHDPEHKQFRLTGEHIEQLYFRPCATSSYGYRFEIVSKTVLGKGAFGQVFDGIDTLVPQNDGSLLSKKSPASRQRVHKLSKSNQNLHANVFWIEHRNRVSRRATHLHTKKNTFHLSDSDVLTSLTAMRKMSGTDLWKLIESDTLKTEVAFSLALNILRAYRDQISIRHLIHGDIKPENIMTDAGIANFIDYDLGKIPGERDNRTSGSTGYQSLELSRADNTDGTTSQSDMYALGITVGEIFLNLCAVNKHFVLQSTFKQPTDLTTQEQRMLINCVFKMTQSDPEKRGSINDAIIVFEQVELNRLGQSHAIYYHAQITTFAVSIRKQFAGSPSTPHNISDFLDSFIREANQWLPDIQAEKPALLKKFIARVLGLQLIDEYHNKEQVIALASQIRLDYQQISHDIDLKLALLQRYIKNTTTFHAPLLKKIVDQAEQFVDHIQQKWRARSEKYPLSLDNIKLICDKLKKEQKQLSDYILFFGKSPAYPSESDICRLFKPLAVERKPLLKDPPAAKLAAAAADDMHPTPTNGLSVCSYPDNRKHQ